MQFIAVTTKDGHVFYVLINYTAKNGEDNVYFLNKVDDYDLYALLYAGEDKDSKITPEQAHKAAENANGRVNGSAAEDETAETAEDTESETEVQQQKLPVNMGSIYLVFGAIALIGIGAAGFILTKKKGKSKSASEFEQVGADSEEDEDYDFYDENSEDDE